MNNEHRYNPQAGSEKRKCFNSNDEKPNFKLTTEQDKRAAQDGIDALISHTRKELGVSNDFNFYGD